MSLTELWEKALKKTEIIRPRVIGLSSTSSTKVPYIFLAESSVNEGDTVVRNGEIVVDQPIIMMPHQLPQFEGFDFGENFNCSDDTVLNLLLVRGVHFPSLKFNNQTSSVDLYEGSLKKASKYYLETLQKKEDVRTSLVLGPEDAWQFSILILIAAQAQKASDGDIRHFLDRWKRNRE